MGANYSSMLFNGKLSKKELQSKVNDQIEQDGYDFGHSGYSGSWYEKPFDELDFISQIFKSEAEAEDFIQDHNDKWAPLMAARCIEGDREAWVVGGWCSS